MESIDWMEELNMTWWRVSTDYSTKKKICVLIYFGDHEDVEKFLRYRRGYDFCYDPKNQDIKTVYNSK